MKIGFIGCGNMGGALAKRCSVAGHQVMLSSRHKEKSEACAKECGKNAKAGTVADAVKFGDIVVLAVPYSEVNAALKSAGDLKGKILVDITNALTPDFSGLALGFTTSAAEEIAKLAPNAKVVKAFNTIFAQLLQSPKFKEGPANVFICGDDQKAKSKVSELSKDIGFEPVDVGPLNRARFVEPLGMLNIICGYYQKMGTNIAFRLIRK